jgi:hypothetical protein
LTPAVAYTSSFEPDFFNHGVVAGVALAGHFPQAYFAGFASVLDDLAWLSYPSGSSGKAEQLFNRALAIREDAAGPNSPEVSTSLYNLAGFYDKTDN